MRGLRARARGCRPRCRILALASLLATGCSSREKAPEEPQPISIDSVARQFVELSLSIGRFDEDYIDAYQGPTEWREEAKADTRTLGQLLEDANQLEASLASIEEKSARLRHLRRSVTAMVTRIRMLQGERLSLDQETRLIYDAVAPRFDVSKLDAALSQLGALLPGEGDLAARVRTFQKSLETPRDKLKPVFEAAVAECRRRTLEHLRLPEGERLRIEYVNDKPWMAYNRYSGDLQSLIQVNADLRFHVHGVIGLACHEGYPGHHAWGVLRERALVGEKQWEEFLVYPLFSPQSVIAEGLAVYAEQLAFSPHERLAFERDVLFPLAGLPPDKAEAAGHVRELLRQLTRVDEHVARRYLDGLMNEETAIELLMRYTLRSPEQAEHKIRFLERYRGYSIAYGAGWDLVRNYVEARAGSDSEARWKVYAELITTPLTASDLLTEPTNQ